MSKGKEYIIDGKTLELFTIGELASRLDRQRQTLRKWERDGVIPQAVFRSGSNRRLYTRNQIEVIVRCVKKYNIKQGYPIPREFKEEVHREFKKATALDLGEDIEEEGTN